MPELPEVQTIVNQLKEKLVGKTVTDVEVGLSKIFEGPKEKVIGAKISDVQRRAKVIVIKLDNDLNITVHLKMTGQLVYGESKNEEVKSKNNEYLAGTVSFSQGIANSGFSLPSKNTHVIFSLNDGGKLFFNDLRQFGWVKIVDSQELRAMSQDLGPEPFEKDFTLEYFKKICNNWGRPIKILLMEQEKIAGVGNIYANEALWYAGVSPMKRARDIEKGKVEKLYEDLKMVLEMGLKYQGTSDNSYVDALGGKGSMQEYFKVYGKTGNPCERCGNKITFSKISGRGTFFCPKCQT
jgi:formamidopyrimidine-DNA glycosylase